MEVVIKIDVKDNNVEQALRVLKRKLQRDGFFKIIKLKNINMNSKVIISIFAGRMADSGKDPLPVFRESIKLSKKFKNVEILWASVREPYNYLQANQLGCHIITVPPKIIEKIEKFGKSFSKLSIETVKGFLMDAKKSKFNI